MTNQTFASRLLRQSPQAAGTKEKRSRKEENQPVFREEETRAPREMRALGWKGDHSGRQTTQVSIPVGLPEDSDATNRNTGVSVAGRGARRGGNGHNEMKNR